MKRMIKKLKKWQLPTLVVNAFVFYTFVSFSILWVLVDFIALSDFGKNLSIISYICFFICLALSVIFAKKTVAHLVKIKRGGFD